LFPNGVDFDQCMATANVVWHNGTKQAVPFLYPSQFCPKVSEFYGDLMRNMKH
jgi:hypothetical protein